ncbi:hypothetical protein OKW41_002190 [Paraburkholderia sp. UCT70]|uniref:hypothetical protein n=1 Tax=Paraburkholderia sp. UCT70 TaxID=2991068 RepID=UPI003D1D8C69
MIRVDVRQADGVARREQRRRRSTLERQHADLPVASRIDRRQINEKRNATDAVRSVNTVNTVNAPELTRRALAAHSDKAIELHGLARACQSARRDSRQQ